MNYFQTSNSMGENYYLKSGLQTGNNDYFLRFSWEIDLGNNRFVWYDKGGPVRKWYGNNLYLIKWGEFGEELKDSGKAVFRNSDYYFKEAISYSLTTSSSFCARYRPQGFIFDNQGSSLFPISKEYDLLYSLALLNSSVNLYIVKALNPTMVTQVGDLAKVPFTKEVLKLDLELVKQNIAIAKEDWDNHEISWDFKYNSLVKLKGFKIGSSMISYKEYWESKAQILQQNETSLNKQLIEIYGLNDELKPEVLIEEVTILQDESKIENGKLILDPNLIILQFISYSVGCFFGRFSIDKDGIILGKKEETLNDFNSLVNSATFIPDEDNILPVLDGEWFNDDIVGRFKVFLKAVFGEECFEENYKYIEETIRRKEGKSAAKGA
jgi:hypothetical protein